MDFLAFEDLLSRITSAIKHLQIEIFTVNILVYDVNNDVADTRQLLSDWLEPKNARSDSGLNEHFHSDQNHRRHSHGDSYENAGGDHRLYDTLGFNATCPTRGDSHENVRDNARGDSREWGRCLTE